MVLSVEAQRLLRQADTTFIATSSRRPEQGGNHGLDVSHRGGRPGFVRVDVTSAGTRLTLPDFSGNFMFNTLGNLEEDPRAGIMALDFTSGHALSLTGTCAVRWSGPELEYFSGAERLLDFRVHSGVLWRNVAFGWSEAQLSPHLRDTGVW